MLIGYALLGLLAGYVLGRFHENRVMQREMEAMAQKLDPASLQKARKDAKNAPDPESTEPRAGRKRL